MLGDGENDMKGNQKKYKTSLSIVLLFVFLFAVTISVFSYFLSVTARQKQAEEKLIIQKSSNHFENLDSALLSTFHSLSYLSRMDSLTRFADAPTVEQRRYQAIEVQRDIQSAMLMGSSLSYCQVAVMYMGEDDALVVTQDSSYSRKDYARSIGVKQEQLDGLCQGLEEQPFGHQIVHGRTEGGKEYVHYAIRLAHMDVPLFLILSIDKENFEHAFPFTDYQDWMILSGEEILIARNELSAEYQQLARELVEREVSFQTDGITQTDLTFLGNPVLCAPFSEIGWMFVATYRAKKVTLADVMLLLILPFLVLCICSILPARLIFRYLYKPVDLVVTQLGGTTKDAGNEFEFIWKKTLQISEHAKELDENLRQNQKLLEKQLVGNAFLGQNFNVNSVHRPQLHKQCYIAVWVEKADSLDSSDQFALYKTAIHDISASMEEITFVRTSAESFVLITAASVQAKARDMVTELFAKVELLSHVQIQAAVSDCIVGIQNLHTAYNQCMRLLEYRRLLNGQLFITQADVESIYYDGYYYPLKVENELIELMLAGRDSGMALLDEVIHENMVDKPLSPENKRAFFFALLSTLNRIYQELHITADDGFSKINEILNNTDAETAQTQIRSAYGKIIKVTQKRGESVKQDVSSLMLDYIYNHYAEDISLDSIAQTLNISPKYCSALFKRQTGNTFKRFLNEYRIEQAKQKLEKNSDIKISTLAEQSGFISANTFIQVFKQYTGTTPHQYAKNRKD